MKNPHFWYVKDLGNFISQENLLCTYPICELSTVLWTILGVIKINKSEDRLYIFSLEIHSVIRRGFGGFAADLMFFNSECQAGKIRQQWEVEEWEGVN